MVNIITKLTKVVVLHIIIQPLMVALFMHLLSIIFIEKKNIWSISKKAENILIRLNNKVALEEKKINNALKKLNVKTNKILKCVNTFQVGDINLCIETK